jgi:hypothetical protein
MVLMKWDEQYQNSYRQYQNSYRQFTQIYS